MVTGRTDTSLGPLVSKGRIDIGYRSQDKKDFGEQTKIQIDQDHIHTQTDTH